MCRFSVISGHLQQSNWFLYLLPEGSRSVHSLRWGWLESLTVEQAPLWTLLWEISEWSSQAVLVTPCRCLWFITPALPYHSVMQLEKLLRIFGDEPNVLSPFRKAVWSLQVRSSLTWAAHISDLLLGLVGVTTRLDAFFWLSGQLFLYLPLLGPFGHSVAGSSYWSTGRSVTRHILIIYQVPGPSVIKAVEFHVSCCCYCFFFHYQRECCP